MEDSKISQEALMNDWRNYFKNGNRDIFEIIKRAIMVAASHHPTEFQLKRGSIAQALFSINCSSSADHVEQEENTGSMKINNHECQQDTINNSSHGDTEQHLVHQDQKPNMDAAEVLKIKQIIDRDDQYESVVYECLWKLQEMGLCFKTLEATGIGRSVSGFQNHASTDIRHIARRLIKKWRGVVDEWINATENTSCVVQEEKQKEECIIKPAAAEKEMVSMGMKKESTGVVQEQKEKQVVSMGMKKESSRVVKIKIKTSSEKAKMGSQERTRSNNITSIEKKLEASKRKLHQRYEEAETAKRQRKIQVMELDQLKKQGLVIPQTKKMG